MTTWYFIVGEALFLAGLFTVEWENARKLPLAPACAMAAVSVILWPLLLFAFFRVFFQSLNRYDT